MRLTVNVCTAGSLSNRAKAANKNISASKTYPVILNAFLIVLKTEYDG